MREFHLCLQRVKEEIDPEAVRKIDEEIEKTLREVSRRQWALVCVCMHIRVCVCVCTSECTYVQVTKDESCKSVLQLSTAHPTLRFLVWGGEGGGGGA